jgi:phenylalanyl-tRNA synthetase alpha chain
MLHLTDDQLAHALTVRDLSDPATGRHCMQQLIDTVVVALTTRWGSVARTVRGTRIVSVADNYDALNYPHDGAVRGARHTRYVSAHTVLRSQMSATVPAALRALAPAPPGDVLLVCPGVVYRRDVIDRLHVGEPHQLDLWRIAAAPMTTGDLEEMIAVACASTVAGGEWRTRPTRHPYTVEGREIEVRAGDRWVELGECGIAHPDVLAAAGLRGHHGLAMGLGLDRAVMLAKGIDDIRLLRDPDPRVAGQMLHLQPYRPVSAQPAVRRDLSLAANPGADDVTIAEAVRTALGPQADWVEQVTIRSRAAYRELPEPARERIGIRPGQENLLVAVTLRHPSRSLTKAEANALRDRIYAALHQGRPSAWQTTCV